MALMLKVLPFSENAAETKKFGSAYDLERQAVPFSMATCDLLVIVVLISIDAPLWGAGDVHWGRSLPPGGKRLFEIQVQSVCEHLQAILHL